MRPSTQPTPVRKRIYLGMGLFALGLALPAMVWLSFPEPVVRQASAPTPTPEIIRIGRPLDEPIPANWESPQLNPELDAAVLEIAETLPLSETGGLSETLPVTTATFATEAPALVASEALNLRDGPGGGYVALQVLPQHTPLTVVGRHDGWYQVVTEAGVLGWADDDFVATSVVSASLPVVEEVPDPAPALVAELDADAANLRAGPSREFASLDVLSPDDGAVTLLTRREGWYNVRTSAGAEGWVSADLLATSDYIARRVPVLSANPEALEAVRLARRYIGYAYVWGGASPRQGFDCSGLVKYVYGKLGVELPHGSVQQWNSGIGTKITKKRNLQPGDIVYFKNTYRRGISHVGIYAGNGLIIQAISESVGIRVSSLDEPYWSSRYVGAIRIFE